MEIRQAYKDLFTGDLGQTVLNDLITRGHILEGTVSDMQEGERRIVLHVLNMIYSKPVEEFKLKLEELTKNG